MNVSLSRCANYFEELDKLLADVMDGAVVLGENLYDSGLKYAEELAEVKSSMLQVASLSHDVLVFRKSIGEVSCAVDDVVSPNMCEMADDKFSSTTDVTENEDSISSGSVLSLRFSSSPFERHNSSSASDESSHRVEPYLYEPEDSGTEDTSEYPDDDTARERLSNAEWCTCGHCAIMPTPTECVCCQEVTATSEKIATTESDTMNCITQHEGFENVCLNVWVLQTSYYTYRQHYGTRDVREEPQQEQYRFIAYRQLTSWCWGWLERRVRVTLPSCAIDKIRSKFPSTDGHHTGLKYPPLT